MVAPFNQARTPFPEQGGSGTCPPRHSPKGFFRKDGKNIHTRQKRERKKAPHTYLRLSRPYGQKDGTDLSRMLFTPLPPCAARWWGHQVLSAGRRPREAEGTLSPSRSLAASPAYEISGWAPEGKSKMGYLSHGMFHWGPAAPVCCTEGGSTRPPQADAMPFRSRPATASSSHVLVVSSRPRNRSP